MKTNTVHLADVCDRIDYGFTASADFSIKAPRLLRITDIQNGTVIWRHVPGCRITPREEAGNRLAVGDIVIARTGATTGKSFLIKHAPRAVFASYLIRLRANGKVLPAYLSSFLESDTYWRQLRRAVRGAAQGGVNATLLSALLLPVPDLGKQEQIAGMLEKADRLRRLRRYATQLSEMFLKSVFLKMFAGFFEVDQPKARLIDLVRITGGGTPSREVSAYFTGPIPWLTSKDMKSDYIWDTQEHVTEKAIANSATKLVPSGSILVVIKSKVLMHRLPLAISRVPLCHGQDIKSIQCSKRILPEFCRYLLKYYEPNLLHIARGANTEGLTLPMLEGLLVPDVGLPLQQEFAEIVKRFERMRVQQREAERQAEHLFQSLLHRAFATQN